MGHLGSHCRSVTVLPPPPPRHSIFNGDWARAGAAGVYLRGNTHHVIMAGDLRGEIKLASLNNIALVFLFPESFGKRRAALSPLRWVILIIGLSVCSPVLCWKARRSVGIFGFSFHRFRVQTLRWEGLASSIAVRHVLAGMRCNMSCHPLHAVL